MRLFTMIVLTALGLTQTYQITRQQNMVRTRGQTPVADPSQSLNRGRMGSQVMLPMHPLTYSGILVDAACVDRTPDLLRQPPESLAAKQPAGYTGSVLAAPIGGAASAFGITVDPQTLAAERADVLPHLNPEVLSRQSDPSCAVTASTSAFALLLNDNRLFNLDAGGNTLAAAALLTNPAAVAMLNGKGPGIKPYTVTKALPYGDRLYVDRILQLGPSPTT
ncbi:MAG TPA: hypothetical protein VMA31_17250 [Bryobacteraceae bacterium]|nr:hypothetical protein [Bryobacteraceae bacterium]